MKEGVWTPILMLTAKTGEYDEAEALDTGADDFLSKPFSFVVLAARLRALVRRGRRRGPRARRRGPGARPGPPHVPAGRGRRSSSPAASTPCSRPWSATPATLSTKARLLSEVWGDDFNGDDNVVEVYVRYLRRKIDRPFGRRSLQTVRSISGYRLDPDG